MEMYVCVYVCVLSVIFLTLLTVQTTLLDHIQHWNITSHAHLAKNEIPGCAVTGCECVYTLPVTRIQQMHVRK